MTPQSGNRLTPHRISTKPDAVKRGDSLISEESSGGAAHRGVAESLDANNSRGVNDSFGADYLRDADDSRDATIARGNVSLVIDAACGDKDEKTNSVEVRERDKRKNRRLSRLETIVAKECELIKIDGAEFKDETSEEIDASSSKAEEADPVEANPVKEGLEEKEGVEDPGADKGSSFSGEGRDDAESIVAFICSEDVMKIAIPLEQDEREEEQQVEGESDGEGEIWENNEIIIHYLKLVF